MGNRYSFLSVFVIALLFSCNSQKNANTHSHDGTEPHSHTAENTLNTSNDYFDAYDLEDEDFGTKTKVTISNDKRIMTTNALPNHKTGTFPNQGNPNTISAQQRIYTFPVDPKHTGKSQWVREPGVALNGVKFEPGTAEVVACETGENYRVEALQDVIDLGLDFNHAHVQPTGAYHYHGTPTSVIENFDSGEDLVHVGFAHDGFPMYYSKSGKYKPSFKLLEDDREGENCSYENPHVQMDISLGGHHDGTVTSDFEYVEGSGDLDECNGINIDGEYMYLVTNEFPYVSRCLMGEVAQEEKRQIGMQGDQKQGGKPNATQILELMDANKDGKLSESEVKGPLKEDFSKIDANNDGFISKKELGKAPKGNRQRPQGGKPQDGRD